MNEQLNKQYKQTNNHINQSVGSYFLSIIQSIINLSDIN